jgi:ascorbate-specific PTS system EIIC-type component UlaA
MHLNPFVMNGFQKTVLGFLLLLTGLSAGQMYHEMAGAQEALQTVDNHTYITYWQSLDKLMHVRMPVMSNLLLIVFLIALILLKRAYKTLPYWLLIVGFLAFVAETIVTVKLQLPVNAQIQRLKVNVLPPDVLLLKSATMSHFIVRAVLRVLGFLLVIAATLKLPSTSRR